MARQADEVGIPGRIWTEENAARRRPGGAGPDELPGVTTRVVLMMILRSLALFAAAAVAEIGGAWLLAGGPRTPRRRLDRGRDHRAGAYGLVATLQPEANFGRILAAYGGGFVAGSLAWGMLVDGFKPDRFDLVGALICLVGVGVIIYAPRPS
jgi:small multidrug resistance family-3 protein